jgi:GNAT superfamily N-acetyltransferase
MAMEFTVRPVTAGVIDDLDQLFATEDVASRCWCMWFIIPVNAFHSAGQEGNAASFRTLADNSSETLGLLAYHAGKAVGWCAVGPRARYARALKTPTYKSVAGDQHANIWLLPCFFVHPGLRRSGATRVLLEAAIRLATEHGAVALDGFPFAGTKPRSSGDRQVGYEGLFASCGFEVIARPSAARVVMRRVLRSK